MSVDGRTPCIGISLSFEPPNPARYLFKNKPLQYLEEGMILAVARAGGTPLLLPDLRDEDRQASCLERCDGLLLSGGTDVAPPAYGEEPSRAEWRGEAQRDVYELALLHAAVARGLPVLGICRGCQLLNVGLGGTLWQDLEELVGREVCHVDREVYDRLEHDVDLEPQSRLAQRFGRTSLTVNSVHHQAVRDVGQGLRAVARARDGTVEAIESVDDRFLLGIQWHPEWLDGDEPVMAWFVEACRA